MSGRFFKRYHRLPDLNRPVLLDEKLITLYVRQYLEDDRVAVYTDKLLVREQPEILEAGPEQLFPRVYRVWDKASEITLEGLPGKFVLKCNHDSGSTVIIEKSEINGERLEELKKFFARKLATPYCVRGQYHYGKIRPRVYAEEFLAAGDGASPADLKFFCMNGKSRACLVVERNGHKARRVMVDSEFKRLDYLSEHLMDEDYERFRPENFARMEACAESLARDFPFVRVDMYDVDGRMILGEMTFSPMGCLNAYINRKGQEILGGYLQI